MSSNLRIPPDQEISTRSTNNAAWRTYEWIIPALLKTVIPNLDGAHVVGGTRDVDNATVESGRRSSQEQWLEQLKQQKVRQVVDGELLLESVLGEFEGCHGDP